MELRPASYFVLAALLDGPLHGYAISTRAAELSGDEVRLTAGTLYGALDRMAARGLVEIDGEETVDGRLRRYYRLTDGGRDAVARGGRPAGRGRTGRPGAPHAAETGEGPRMTGRARRRLSHTLTGLATHHVPEGAPERCPRGARLRPRGGGRHEHARTAARVSVARHGGHANAHRPGRDGVWHAPWRDALAVLALPLAATLLLVWTFGFISRYDHWPLGEGWALLLGGSLLAVIGAALERRLARGRGRDRRVRRGGVALRRLRDRGWPSPARRASSTAGASTSAWRRCSPPCCSWPLGSACGAGGATGPRRPRAAGGGTRARRSSPRCTCSRTVARADHRDDPLLAGREASALTRGALPDALDPGIASRCCGSSASRWPWRSS